MKQKLSCNPYVGDDVDICDNEKCTRELEQMVEAMKGAVAMDIVLFGWNFCSVSLFSRNRFARKARLQLAATMSSEQSGARTTGESVWLGIESYAALFKYETMRNFTFRWAGVVRHDGKSQDLTLHTFVRKLGLSIAKNANSVQCLRINAENGGFAKQLLSLDAWKEAFPSLKGAYLISDPSYDASDVSPHLRKHVRSLALFEFSGAPMIHQGYLDLIGSMIRKNVIAEICFDLRLLCHTKVLDDTLRSVRSFQVRFSHCPAITLPPATAAAMDNLARSFERTKADGDKLQSLSVHVSASIFSETAVETMIRSRPNLQVLSVQTFGSRDFFGVCQAVASSTLTKFVCIFYLTYWSGVAIVGELMQHSTIRDLELIASIFPSEANAFVEGVAEGLRATRLRRFHLTMSFHQEGVSIAVMTKLYESLRENRSLMDIQLKGEFWDPWRESLRNYYPREPPCPFSFFDFLSSRNQYLSQVLLPYEYSLPAGLWPLILESASSDASILYYLLTFQPHLAEGTVKRTVAADREWTTSPLGSKIPNLPIK